jgi:hypothetical protein
MNAFSLRSSVIRSILESNGYTLEDFADDIFKIIRNTTLSKLYFQAFIMDLLWMLEESSSDLLDNENMADSAMSLVGIIEFEVLDLIDDIFTSLQYAGVTNPQIRGLHLQLPDTFTVELVNNEIRRRP